MSEIHVDGDMRELGTISWFKGYGPRGGVFPYEGECGHSMQLVIAWGPDEKHYELCECADCDARAWTNGRTDTTPWLAESPL